MKTSNVLLLVFVAVVVIVGGAVLIMNANSASNPGVTGQVINTQPAQNSTNTQTPTNTQAPTNTQTPTTSVPVAMTTPASNGSANNVIIQSFAFSPQTLTVNVGDTVTWTNLDSVAHTVISDVGNEISSPSLNQGQSYSHTFVTGGRYTYHCSIHPNMTGTIIVKSPNSSTNTNSSSSSSSGGGY
jgi:plastocyanin